MDTFKNQYCRFHFLAVSSLGNLISCFTGVYVMLQGGYRLMDAQWL